MFRIKTAIATAAFAATCMASAPAFAKVWDFSFTDMAGDAGRGQLTTAAGLGPNYAITAIDGVFTDTGYTGAAGTYSIGGLSPYAAADNILQTATTPQFSFSGISFLSDGVAFNLFADGTQYGQLLESANNPVGFPNQGNFSELKSLSITPVPEPASWALMIIGLGGIGSALRSRRRTAASAA